MTVEEFYKSNPMFMADDFSMLKQLMRKKKSGYVTSNGKKSNIAVLKGEKLYVANIRFNAENSAVEAIVYLLTSKLRKQKKLLSFPYTSIFPMSSKEFIRMVESRLTTYNE